MPQQEYCILKPTTIIPATMTYSARYTSTKKTCTLTNLGYEKLIWCQLNL